MHTTYIARIANEINRVYAYCIGQEKSKFEQLKPEEIENIKIGVKFCLANPTTTPEEIHAKWRETKLAAGWSYGPIINLHLKQHPNMINFYNLPISERIKDHIFVALVKELNNLFQQLKIS